MRTVVDSVPRVTGPPDSVAALDDALAVLRSRHPGAHVQRYLDRVPTSEVTTYIAPGAVVVGAVVLGPEVSVWFGSVLRGDVNRIEIGARSNVQDGAVIHVGDRDATLVGEDVVVGHRAVLHGCRLEDGVLVGIQATVLDGARVGQGSIIGAGALVASGAEVPPRSLVVGTPGRVVRTLAAADEAFHRALAGKYTRLAHNYRTG